MFPLIAWMSPLIVWMPPWSLECPPSRCFELSWALDLYMTHSNRPSFLLLSSSVILFIILNTSFPLPSFPSSSFLPSPFSSPFSPSQVCQPVLLCGHWTRRQWAHYSRDHSQIRRITGQILWQCKLIHVCPYSPRTCEALVTSSCSSFLRFVSLISSLILRR